MSYMSYIRPISQTDEYHPIHTFCYVLRPLSQNHCIFVMYAELIEIAVYTRFLRLTAHRLNESDAKTIGRLKDWSD